MDSLRRFIWNIFKWMNTGKGSQGADRSHLEALQDFVAGMNI